MVGERGMDEALGIPRLLGTLGRSEQRVAVVGNACLLLGHAELEPEANPQRGIGARRVIVEVERLLEVAHGVLGCQSGEGLLSRST